MVCKVRNLLKKLKKFSLLRIFENTVFKVTAHRAHRGSTVIKKTDCHTYCKIWFIVLVYAQKNLFPPSPVYGTLYSLPLPNSQLI